MNQENDFNDNQSNPQDGGSSPFSADLKSDFTSNFGSNTNAVSQIFKEGGFVGDSKTRLIGIVTAIIAVVVVGAFVLSPSDEDFEDEDFAALESEKPGDEKIDDLTGEGVDDLGLGGELPIGDKKNDNIDMIAEKDGLGQKADDMPMGGEMAIPEADSGFADEPVEQLGSSQTVAPTLSGPEDGHTLVYSEIMTPAEFMWQGDPGGWLFVSESPSMSPVTMKRKVSGNSYRLRKLVPGTYYWQVKNGAGRSGVRSVTIYPAPLRNLSLVAPAEGASLSGSGGNVSWTGDSGVSYYRVEISSSGWANPNYRFATSGTQLAVQGVPSGQYELRVGAFSEVSGRWEYVQPINVSIQ